jgi:molybdenum cofactor cytidylyltransferase
MPFIRPTTIDALLQRFAEVPPDSIVLPTYDGQPGHPVLFSIMYRDELRALQGDVGARSVVEAHAADLQRLPVDDPGILRDVDTREAYEKALRSAWTP